MVGQLCVDNHTEAVVEFIGGAWGGGHAGEDVAVFRTVDDSGTDCLLTTQRDHYHGQTFHPLGDHLVAEMG